MLFLDVFFSVSNQAIVVVFLAGRVVAGGGLGDSRRVSPTPVRRCPSKSLRLRGQAMEEGKLTSLIKLLKRDCRDRW